MTKIAFSLLAAVALLLAAISLFPVHAALYTSAWMVGLWAATAAAAVCVMVRRRLWRQPAVFALHAAFIVVLAGAMITHLWGSSERVHVEVGSTAAIGTDSLRLDAFDIEYYPGTAAPADFVATVSIGGGAPVRVSMNRTASAGGTRLFLTSCDADRSGCTFTVARDSAGTAVSYCGYALLLLAMLAISIPHRNHRFIIGLMIVLGASAASAAPRTVPRELADALGRVCVYHNDRVAPMSTLAADFSMKIYGTRSYQGLTPEQVLAGWLFYYDSWKADPGIRLDGRMVSLADFFGPEGYLYDDPDHAAENEKFGLISSAAAGSLWRLFPYSKDRGVQWYSPVDQLPDDMDIDAWRMTRHSLGYLAELVAGAQWPQAVEVVGKIGRYQRLQCADGLPSPAQMRAERVFSRLSGSPWPMIILLAGSILLLIWPRPAAAKTLLCAGALWVASLMALNAVATRHLPIANGYETMQWMALFALSLCLWLGRRRPAALPLGAIVAALALAVALMGQRNPQLTNLMPVLRSPLLSVHVLTVMLSYAMLAIIALASGLWLCGRRELLPMARTLLRPAVFLMAAGIFIGAVWANMSWGRYWGWDPKEVWALITMIVYSFPLHTVSLPSFRRDRRFAIWCLAAFATVLMTYIGVNFLLGGLHSYA